MGVVDGEDEDDEVDEAALAESMVGQRITKARFFDANPDYDWAEHEQCWLWLEDGRVVCFGGWGHDASGVTLTLVEDEKLACS